MLQRKLANEEGVEPDKLHCIGGWSLCRLAHNNVRATTHTVFAFNVRTELAENLPHQVVGKLMPSQLAHNNVSATTHTVFALNVRTELAENLPHQVVGKLMPSQLAKVAASGKEADVLTQLRKTQDRTGSNSL